MGNPNKVLKEFSMNIIVRKKSNQTDVHKSEENNKMKIDIDWQHGEQIFSPEIIYLGNGTR